MHLTKPGRADLPVGLDARQRVPTRLMASMRLQSWRSRLPTTPNPKEHHATRHPIPKPVALSQELQTLPIHPGPNPPERPDLSASAGWPHRKTSMKTNYIERHFASMGARFKARLLGVDPWRASDYAIDIRRDARGPFFELRVPEPLSPVFDAAVLNVVPEDRHLFVLHGDRGAVHASHGVHRLRRAKHGGDGETD